SPVSGAVILNDIDGDVLTATLGAAPTNGTVIVNTDGTYTYTPAADFNGTDTFTVSVDDGNGGTDTATVTITILPVDDAVVANDDSISADEDTGSVTGDATANDVDVEGDAFDVTRYWVGDAVTGTEFAINTSALIPGAGSFTIAPSGAFIFTPVANYNSTDGVPLPIFTYEVEDANGNVDTAVLTITINPVNDAPVTTADSFTGLEDGPDVTGNVLVNDSDIDGPALAVTGVRVAGVTAGTISPGTPIFIPGSGTLRIDANGELNFDPVAGYFGTVPTITYDMSDGEFTRTTTVTITIDPTNDPVDATDDTAVTDQGVTLTVPAATGLLSNDSDPDGDAFAITAISFMDGPTQVTAAVSAGSDGTLTITAGAFVYGTVTIAEDGSYSFVPDAAYSTLINGPMPAITYEVTDAIGATSTAELSIEVTRTNTAPNAVDDVTSVAEDGNVTGNVITDAPGTDTDAEGDAFTLTGFTIGGSATVNLPIGAGGGPVIIPGVGLFLLTSDGDYDFTPDSDYDGVVPTITYTVEDVFGASSTATLTVTIIAANDAPEATDETVTLNEDGNTPLNLTLPTDVDHAST
ncbi:Ig-like domain-containing protein, partial [Ahrensia sp. R2A130]|uniref:Ig-like domain-containing protein n=1 Tax=Ahrensia sp. R2A130 TaxID=744979 RepID=UPI0001E0F131